MSEEIKTPADLERIEARAAAATPGPWTNPEHNPAFFYADSEPIACVFTGTNAPERERQALLNAAFIAASRTDVPAIGAALRDAWRWIDEFRNLGEIGERRMLAMVERAFKAEAERDALRDEVDRLRAAPCDCCGKNHLEWGGEEADEAP